MNYLLTPYAIAQFITAGVSMIVTIIMWQRRSLRGGWALLLLFITITEWSLCNGMEAAAVSQELKIFWSKMAYLGAQTSPVFLVLFALRYDGKIRRLNPAIIGLLFVVPVIIIILAATNEVHNWIWTSFIPGPVGSNSLIYQHGPAFWVGIAYIFTMVSFATTLLILSSVQTQRIYRFQYFIIVAASLMPWLGTLIYLFDLSPFPGLDITSISFLFTGLLLMIGIARGNMLDYIPVAHEFLFASINDGVIVFDEDHKVVDMNPGAERLLSLKFEQFLDKNNTATKIIWDSFRDYLKKDENTHFECISPFNKKIWFNVSISPLQSRKGYFLGWVAILEDITDRKETEEELQQANQRLEHQLSEICLLEDQLREQANRDFLTGVYNRGYLEESLAFEISRAERKGYPLSVIMIDVDNFKEINDTYGHKTGDEVIVALSKMLQNQTRDGDCVSRFGGDEFALVMPDMNCEQAFERAELWRNECKQSIQIHINKGTMVTISIGIAVFPKNGKTIDTLLGKADQALYQAKQSGKDCIRIAD
jgi:diguanylate cyclase (GGDEF)-like protein/PAS domain S-box-containing protein